MENTRIVEAQRKTNLKAEEIQLFKESFVIVPYQTSGFLNYTNQGYNNENIKPEDFETFKRIWTGNDACVLSWKNSVKLTQQIDNEMKISFQLGEVFCGALQTNESENRIQTDVSFTEYKSQDIKKTINFYVNKHFKITDYYLLMFYKIPEYSGSTLYRLANIERDYVGKELVGYVLTFETINQDLANTGKAKQQNIMPNGIGQGYLECVVKQKDWWENLPDEIKNKLVAGKDYYEFYDRYITADFEKVKNRPASKICVKLFGANILSCVVCEGRPVYRGDTFENWRAQRLIFPINFSVPTTPNLYATQNNVNNFYFGGFTPTLEYWKDLMTNMKDNLTPVNKWNYQGWLLYNYSKLQSTNPKAGNGYKYTLYDRDWEPTLDPIPVNNNGVYGSEIEYNIGGTKRIENHLWDNFWTQKQIKTLPINIEENLSYGNTILGGLAMIGSGYFGIGKINPTKNIFRIGIGTVLGVIGLAFTLQQKLKKRLESFRGLIPAALLDFNNSLFGEQQGKIPFNILNTNNNTDTPNEIFFDGSTLNTSFTAELTDRFTTTKVPNKVLSTVNIGQKTFEDGTNILSSGAQYLVDGSESLLTSIDYYEGYIIDSFKIQTIFNGDVSVEFLDYNNEVIWSGVYQSEGKWTKSMREVWTEKNTSVFGRENTYFTNPIPYPKEIPNIQESMVDLDKLYDFSISSAAILGNRIENHTNELKPVGFQPNNPNNLVFLESFHYPNDYHRVNFQFNLNKNETIMKFPILDYQNNTFNIHNYENYKFSFPQLQILLGQNIIFDKCNAGWISEKSNFFFTQEINNDFVYTSGMDLNVEYDITSNLDNWDDYFIDERNSTLVGESIRSSNASHSGTAPVYVRIELYKTTPWKQFKVMFFEENNTLNLQVKIVYKEQWNKNSALYPRSFLLNNVGDDFHNIWVHPNGVFDDTMIFSINSICRKE